MDNWLITHESLIRLSFFIAILVTMVILEALFPRRSILRSQRWFNNISLVVISSFLAKILLPMSLAAFALYSQQSGWGLLQQDFITRLSLPHFALIIFSLLILDLIIYWQHRLFHRIPYLWRLHKVHHSDGEIDVSTGIRFHPLEILLSLAIKFLVIWLFGFSAQTVIIFEILLNGLAMFNHSNVRLPLGIDRIIRSLIVTPDMHRVHHSADANELNKNFGFNLSLWDRLFASYQDQPKLGHQDIQIGLAEYKNSNQETQLLKLLIMPFK